MAKKVLSVGFVFPGDVAEFIPLQSTRSLLDGDLLIFRPSVAPFDRRDIHHSTYKGKPNLSDHASFELKSAASHWKQQISMAVEAGKTVIIFLPSLSEVYVDTGERTHSGTGRNQQTTTIVSTFSNYDMLPNFAGKILPVEGRQMRLTEKGKLLGSYWGEFGAASAYKVIFEGLKGTPLISTATGERPVGCMFTFKGDKGRVIAVPVIDDYDVEPEALKGVNWDKKDKALGHRLLQEFLAIEEGLQSSSDATPAPAWANANEYMLTTERELISKLNAVDVSIEAALSKKSELSESLVKEAVLRRLLYEQGPGLEVGILEALRILGFVAEPYKNGQSEFDAVFTSPELRFLGEAEGKDTKAINIDKLRQLEMNIQEDLARDEVTFPARGVLFGNAFRLQPLSQRPGEYFTEKCVNSAKRTQTSLVRTPDLFEAARAAKESGDEAFAAACRHAILDQGGQVVSFPAAPNAGVVSTPSI